ncbi:MAG: metallophosphoesterase [Devosia sp.]|nr:metallophosphoesterase [Devosia sp.]
MSNVVTFVHLTDLHIGEPGVPDDHLYSDTTANLRAILADVKRMDPAPAFVVASGDLTNRGDVASYRHLQAVIAEAELAMPVLFALGNHDKREGFYEAMLGRTEDNTAPYDHDHVVDGVHVIVLDSSVPGKIGGAFEAGQLDWLKGRLEAHTELPKLLVMHHAPALDEDNPEMEWESLTIADTQALRDLVEDHHVIGILSGHIHFDRVSNWYGIPLVVGIGQHAATDVLDMPRALRMVEGASFAIGTLRDSGLTISFVPQPATRRELHVIDMETMRKFLAAAE